MSEERRHLLSSVDSSQDDSSSDEKTKKLGLLTCISMTMSMTIGVGIFVFPNMVIKEVGSGGGCLVLWMCAGLVATLGALSYTELALLLPGTGAEFVYLKHVYKDWIANLFMFTSAFIKYPAISTIMGQASVTYLVQCVSADVRLTSTCLTLATISLTVITCIIVAISTKFTTNFINLLNICKLLGLAGIISFAIFVTVKVPDKTVIIQKYSFQDTSTEVNTLFIAFFGSIASYEGWNTLNVVAGEISNPQRTIPIATTVAVSLTTLLYVATNAAYIAVLPLEVMKNSKAVALDLGMIAFGAYGKIFLTVCVVCSGLATVFALVICNSRIIQKAANHKQLPDIFKLSHGRSGTPIFAIFLHGIVVCVFSLVTSLEKMTTIIIVISWFFYLLCFLVVIFLRFRDTVTKTTFKVPLIVPVILILISLLLIFTPVTKAGTYRVAFIMALVLLVLLTPLAVLTAVSGVRCKPLTNLSSRVTDWVKQNWNFV